MAQKDGQYHVFVYGTLMRGERNHAVMKDAVYLGAIRTARAGFDLVEFESGSAIGKFTPGLLDNGGYYISGEVYEVDAALLEELDAFELEGVEYTRKRIFLSDGTSAWTYIFIGSKKQVAVPRYIFSDEKQRTKYWLSDVQNGAISRVA
ncbi:MAG: gamma-glutamylcyclotransferase [Alphaproteobacteria bacterium]